MDNLEEKQLEVCGGHLGSSLLARKSPEGQLELGFLHSLIFPLQKFQSLTRDVQYAISQTTAEVEWGAQELAKLFLVLQL